MNKELTEIENRPFPFYGYAPGNYMNTCACCKKDIYNVDKLCFVCLECAITAANEWKKQVVADLQAIKIMENKILSKEEVLEKHSPNYKKWLDKNYGSLYNLQVNGFEVFAAMEEYAQQFQTPTSSTIKQGQQP